MSAAPIRTGVQTIRSKPRGQWRQPKPVCSPRLVAMAFGGGGVAVISLGLAVAQAEDGQENQHHDEEAGNPNAGLDALADILVSASSLSSGGIST